MALDQTQDKTGHLAKEVGPAPRHTGDDGMSGGQDRPGIQSTVSSHDGKKRGSDSLAQNDRGYSEQSFDNLPATQDATVAGGRKRVRKISGE